MLCYGAMIWGHRAPELIEKFRRINRMAINTFANFPRSTPTSALEVMLDLMPLHLFCVQEAVDAVLEFDWHGTSHTKNHAVSHMKFLQDKMDTFGIRSGQTDGCNTLMWDRKFKINRESFDGRAKHRKLTQYNVYTDGSKLDGQTGSGLVVYKGREEIAQDWYRLPNAATVFQAEITAISRAAEVLLTTRTDGMKFIKIFIDSQAAILALGNPHITSVAVGEAISKLNRLAESVTTVTLVWIPAHKGHVGNERADDLAKKGSKETDTQRRISVKTPKATVKAKINQCVYETWQKEWETAPMANHTKSFYSGPSKSKARFVYKLARLGLGRFARIVTGHNNLYFFQTKLGLYGNPECRFCQQGDETITHFLKACLCFYNSRKNIFLDKLPGRDMSWSVRSLLNFSYSKGLNEAFEGTWASGDPPIWDDHLREGVLGSAMDGGRPRRRK